MTVWHLLAELAIAHPVAIGYRCEAHAAGGDGRCDEIATTLVHWPGREPSRQCDRHAAWSAHVGSVFTLSTHPQPLPVRGFDVAPDDGAAIRASMLELD